MAHLNLKTILRAKSGAGAALAALMSTLEGPLGIEDCAGSVLMGTASHGAARLPLMHDQIALGSVTGPPASAAPLAELLRHLLAKEAERHALAAVIPLDAAYELIKRHSFEGGSAAETIPEPAPCASAVARRPVDRVTPLRCSRLRSSSGAGAEK